MKRPRKSTSQTQSDDRFPSRTLVQPALLLTVLLASSPVLAAGVFLEQNGLVVVEVESEPPAGEWMRETAVAGFTGDSYYRMDGNTVQGGNPNGRLSYFIRIQDPGTYHLRIHSHKTNPDSTWANDCYTLMVGHSDYQGTDTKTYMSGASNQWSWNTMHEPGSQHLPPDYTLAAGVHELQESSGRSKDFHIDRFVLFKDPVALGDATDLANQPSPVEGVTTYHLTVQGGTGSGDYDSGQTVSITADPPASGMEFLEWTGDVGTLADTAAQSTTLLMPARHITVAAGYQNVDDGTIVIECEDMQLAGYAVEGELIATMDQGTASIDFPGPAGVYRLTVAIVEEDDGLPTLTVSLAGRLIDTIQYELGTSQRDPRDVDLGLVTVRPGDPILLEGTREGDAAARADKLIFAWDSDIDEEPGTEEQPTVDADGGPEEPVDGGDAQDGGTPDEDTVDAGDTNNTGEAEGGCSCGSPASPTNPWGTFILLILAGLLWRRSRSHQFVNDDPKL